jgi:uncharacterized protein with von Willebrand factor type A (vWA) domain
VFHHCPYFHDDDLMPDEVRQALEHRLFEFLSVREPGPETRAGMNAMQDPTQAPEHSQGGQPRALESMIESICTLATPVRQYSAGHEEISQRISHDIVHRVGHVFSDSNEAAALGALERLRARITPFTPERRLELVSGLGLASARAGNLAEMGSGASGLRREALESALREEIDRGLDEYENRVYRSLIRTHLPKIMADLLEDSRKLADIAEKMQHYFGISSGFWDLRRGMWREIPWDLFEMSRKMCERDPSILRLAEILGRGPGVRGDEASEERVVETLREERYQQREYLGRSEIMGVEFGDDINILLPGEYAQLADPDTEWRFFKELLDGELLVSRFRRSSDQVKTRLVKHREKRRFDRPLGPLVLCIDTSGSMAGWPERVAKALSLALIRICWQQGRKLHAVLFSTDIREMDLSDMEEALPEFSSFFSMEFRGGTDLRPALRASIEKMRRGNFKHADLLIVSDFRVPKIMIKQGRDLERIRTEGGNRVHALTIGLHPIIDSYNMFDTQWHYRISSKGMGLGITGLVEI